ncbi:MAG: ribonuclease P protein component [Ignavibacteriaceae bacterium]|nr:ribonuclease P protein component [Ignavibacteriaceae bacterium]
MKKFGLSADEKLKGRKDIEELFSKGIILYSSTKTIKAVYLIDKISINSGVKVAVAVSHKSGKAYWRNRVKRLLRESYRLNKDILLNRTENLSLFIRIIFSPYSLNMRNNKNISLKDIMPDVIDIMSRISMNV